MEKSSTGLDENVAGLLCYVLGWVSGLVFFLLEQENKFVRFHAIQSILVFGVITVASIVLVHTCYRDGFWLAYRGAWICALNNPDY